MFGLPWWLSDKNFALNAGDLGAIPGSGRFPGGGYGNPLQHPCLANPMDRGAWRTVVHRVERVRDAEVTEDTPRQLMVTSGWAGLRSRRVSNTRQQA